jgi:hypothetical protein
MVCRTQYEGLLHRRLMACLGLLGTVIPHLLRGLRLLYLASNPR